MHITEVPERTTIQFDRTVANVLAQPGMSQLRLVFDIDALGGTHTYIDAGNGILLKHEAVLGEIHVDQWKEREANAIVRSVRRRLLGFLARWRLWKAPMTFEAPVTNSEKGATVKVFNIVVHDREKFVDTYLRLLDAIRQHRHYHGMSIADQFMTQSLTKARNVAAKRGATTDFVLNLDESAAHPGNWHEPRSEPNTDAALECSPTADLPLDPEAHERHARQSAVVPASATSNAGKSNSWERCLVQGREFSLDWD